MSDFVGSGLFWVAICLAFFAGTVWNGRAYDRGRADGFEEGYRTGFNDALGKEQQ